MVGDASEYGTLLQMMLNRIELPEAPEFLILPQSDGQAKPALGVEALPAAAQICSCNNVTKAQICEAVCAGATSIGAMKAACKAGASCGGCVPLVTQVMKSEMKRQGLSVNNHVCEHFPYSRQELYHIVRVEGVKSFGELLAKHGRGLGCDICKPVVASILASCWNEFVLKKEHASLQDSNDYYLANIQRDGTYSVVPRMPGGEVTPEGLIAVGQVAKKYGLYTKITGGQRVDLFGARVEQLPLIWEELIAAGFESGHAYGKSLRTVKSCVGSTWCRYGVGDSVGLAIEVENRYKGLRAPHKIKFGVSGCTRECAEAQGKDIGIIATEKGWNLYVCGNGGMKPRHAELLASDLDKATLIRYIDRFLMFYIRTADRLQRTSVWRDNLEGGLDYLIDVVVKDKLGLSGELEAEMQLVVDTYECEWKKAVTDPETRKRFRHFVNSDAGGCQCDLRRGAWTDSSGDIGGAAGRAVSCAGGCGGGLIIGHRWSLPPGCKHIHPNASDFDPLLTLKEEPTMNGERLEQCWTPVCDLNDIVPDTGVCALINGAQVAIFHVADGKSNNTDASVFALDNFDPNSQASVLSRGLIGSLGERVVVASPIYKHHFDLRTGECLEMPEHSVTAYPARIAAGKVWVAA